MKLPRAQRRLRKRLAYLNAKVAAGACFDIVEERDALDLALRILKWRDDDDVELEAESHRAAVRVLPAERRDRARARRGDELRDRVQNLVLALHRAVGVP